MCNVQSPSTRDGVVLVIQGIEAAHGYNKLKYPFALLITTGYGPRIASRHPSKAKMEPSPLSKEGGGVRTVMFNGKNFENWKYSVSIALKGHKLIPIVDGTSPRPPEVIPIILSERI